MEVDSANFRIYFYGYILQKYVQKPHDPPQKNIPCNYSFSIDANSFIFINYRCLFDTEEMWIPLDNWEFLKGLRSIVHIW